jgi:hypothetical protein
MSAVFRASDQAINMVDNRVVVGSEDAFDIGIRVRIQRQAVGQDPFRVQLLDRFPGVVAKMLRITFIDVSRFAVRLQLLDRFPGVVAKMLRITFIDVSRFAVRHQQ